MTRSLLVALWVISTPVLAAQPASQKVSAARIVAAARAPLDARSGHDGQLLQVAVVGRPEDAFVPTGAVVLSARAVTGRWPRERVGVAVDIRVDDRVVRSATVWFAVAMHQSAWVYAADDPLGMAAAGIKWESSDVDVAAVQGDRVIDPKDVEGMRLRHPVLAGSVALRDDFENTPAVDRQQQVQVSMAMGSIRMQTKGTAQAKGNAGDVIPVWVENAEAPVLARVTDKGVVEVVQ
jgi:flagella basal body P-ring formation protein FlgA